MFTFSLAEMNEVEFETVTPEIRKKIIVRGQRGRRPALKWTCFVDLNYCGSVDCEKFQNGSKQIIIGDGITPHERLIEKCLETMHLNEVSSFRMKEVGESSETHVNITLKSCEEKPYIFQWTDEDKVRESKHFKNMGTELFNRKLIEEAFIKFSLALKLLIMSDSVLETDDPDPEINSLRIALYNNLAQCHLHSRNYAAVIELCNKSIEISCSPKALYRRALAHIEMKEYEKAESDLVQLLKSEPKNKAAMEKYKLVRELDRTNRENYHSVLKKMFS